MFKEVFQELKNNKGSYFILFLAINIATILLLFFTFLYLNLYLFSQKAAKSLTLTIYIKPEATEKEVVSIIKKLKNVSETKNVNWIYPEEVRQKLYKIFRNYPEIFQEIDSKSLPSFIEVSFKNPIEDFKKAKPYLKKLEKEETILKIRYAESWLGRIINFTKLIKSFVLLGSLLLIFSLAFLMAITINITLEKQRKEIEILFLLGATPSYIAKPKILVSFSMGTVSFFLALGVLFVLKSYLEKALYGLLPFYDFKLMLFPWTYIILGAGGIGLFCALVSWFSVQRYFS